MKNEQLRSDPGTPRDSVRRVQVSRNLQICAPANCEPYITSDSVSR
jgi:hypothetical protein